MGKKTTGATPPQQALQSGAARGLSYPMVIVIVMANAQLILLPADGNWKLDEHTKRIGRAGLAQARAALMEFPALRLDLHCSEPVTSARVDRARVDRARINNARIDGAHVEGAQAETSTNQLRLAA